MALLVSFSLSTSPKCHHAREWSTQSKGFKKLPPVVEIINIDMSMFLISYEFYKRFRFIATACCQSSFDPCNLAINELKRYIL